MKNNYLKININLIKKKNNKFKSKKGDFMGKEIKIIYFHKDTEQIEVVYCDSNVSTYYENMKIIPEEAKDFIKKHGMIAIDYNLV